MPELGAVVHIARCPEHGLHGDRTECFVCGGPVEQVPMVPATTDGDGRRYTVVPSDDVAAVAGAHTDREWVAELLNALPFVRWDRFTQTDDELVVYGWIDREDAHADFVLVEFTTDGSVGWSPNSSATRWTTSSSQWSRPELGYQVLAAVGPCKGCGEPIQPGQMWAEGPRHLRCRSASA